MGESRRKISRSDQSLFSLYSIAKTLKRDVAELLTGVTSIRAWNTRDSKQSQLQSKLWRFCQSRLLADFSKRVQPNFSWIFANIAHLLAEQSKLHSDIT